MTHSHTEIGHTRTHTMHTYTHKCLPHILRILTATGKHSHENVSVYGKCVHNEPFVNMAILSIHTYIRRCAHTHTHTQHVCIHTQTHTHPPFDVIHMYGAYTCSSYALCAHVVCASRSCICMFWWWQGFTYVVLCKYLISILIVITIKQKQIVFTNEIPLLGQSAIGTIRYWCIVYTYARNVSA